MAINEFRVIADIRLGEGFHARFGPSGRESISHIVQMAFEAMTAQTGDGAVGVFDDVDVIDVEPIVDEGLSAVTVQQRSGIAVFSVTAKDGTRAVGEMDGKSFFHTVADWDRRSVDDFRSVPGVVVSAATLSHA